MFQIFKLFLSMILLVGLMGCSSFAKGLVQGVMSEDQVDNRLCEITGSGFEGVKSSVVSQVEEQTKTTKVLMVHGIGKHSPGYATRMKEGLARELGLSLTEATIKEIRLQHDDFKSNMGEPESLGLLRVSRHLDEEKKHEMLFYELTWSEISDQGKELLAFDTSGEYSFKRAGTNQMIKKFFNEHVPDILIYMGSKKEHIRASVGQSICWMLTKDWGELSDSDKAYCDIFENGTTLRKIDDDLFFITHSLGSRITIDTTQRYAELITNSDKQEHQQLVNVLKNKKFTVFMLANQLPLIQLGHDAPEITRQVRDYCDAHRDLYQKRLLGELKIIAFSDPNDILSYPVPPKYADGYIDSRLCPDVVNVNINIAHVKSLLGTTELANPLVAHGGYDDDERTVKLIAHGLKKDSVDPLVKDRCHWTRFVPDDEMKMN